MIHYFSREHRSNDSLTQYSMQIVCNIAIPDKAQVYDQAVKRSELFLMMLM
jgi:hypothetical protein